LIAFFADILTFFAAFFLLWRFGRFLGDEWRELDVVGLLL